MGRGDGVEIRASSIRLFFVWQGQQHRETLYVGDKPMLPTQANIAHARRLAGCIRREIELGSFNLADHFPKSKRAGTLLPSSFGALADAWLASKGHLAAIFNMRANKRKGRAAAFQADDRGVRLSLPAPSLRKRGRAILRAK